MAFTKSEIEKARQRYPERTHTNSGLGLGSSLVMSAKRHKVKLV